MFEEIKEHLSWLIPAAGVVIWGVRLESRSTTNSKAIDRLEAQDTANLAAYQVELAKFEVRLDKQRSEDQENRRRDWDMLSKQLSNLDKKLDTMMERLIKNG